MSTIEIKIGNTMVGPDHPPYLLAEIGINHDGDFNIACDLIRQAEGKCNGVKFQAFTADTLFNRDYLPEDHDRFKGLELTKDQFRKLKRIADDCGLDFIATPFDLDWLNFLVELGVPAIKIASGDLTYEPLLEAAGRTGLPVILSTGMSDLQEIENAMRAIDSHGFELNSTTDIILLHCISNYPAVDANFNFLISLKENYEVIVGYSDHTQDENACMTAIMLGACLIEKHFTYDITLNYGDHPHSVDAHELAKLNRDIKAIRKMLKRGDNIRSDYDNRNTMRRNPKDWLRPLDRPETPKTTYGKRWGGNDV